MNDSNITSTDNLVKMTSISNASTYTVSPTLKSNATLYMNETNVTSSNETIVSSPAILVDHINRTDYPVLNSSDLADYNYTDQYCNDNNSSNSSLALNISSYSYAALGIGGGFIIIGLLILVGLICYFMFIKK